MSEETSLAGAADIIAFWTEAGHDRWFNKDDAFDAEIRRRFLATHEAAAAGKFAAWEMSAEGALALLILLDQFPRNMFRKSARAFATPAAIVPTPTSATSFTDTSARGFTVFRSWMSCARSSIE